MDCDRAEPSGYTVGWMVGDSTVRGDAQSGRFSRLQAIVSDWTMLMLLFFFLLHPVIPCAVDGTLKFKN